MKGLDGARHVSATHAAAALFASASLCCVRCSSRAPPRHLRERAVGCPRRPTRITEDGRLVLFLHFAGHLPKDAARVPAAHADGRDRLYNLCGPLCSPHHG